MFLDICIKGLKMFYTIFEGMLRPCLKVYSHQSRDVYIKFEIYPIYKDIISTFWKLVYMFTCLKACLTIYDDMLKYVKTTS